MSREKRAKMRARERNYRIKRTNRRRRRKRREKKLREDLKAVCLSRQSMKQLPVS